jgi:hypothetical protein
MENMFVWMLVFAGATIGLLGIFLVASERELKIKRQEVEALEAEFARNLSQTPADNVPGMPSSESDAPAKLESRNRELLDEIASLSKTREANERTISEFQATRHRLENTETDYQRLVSANHELEEQLSHLKKQLQSSEAQLTASANQQQNVTDRHSILENTISELKRELELGKAKIHQLESVKEEFSDVAFREESLRQQTHQLEAQIAELRAELSAAHERAHALEGNENKLKELERAHQSLHGDKNRLQEENKQWQDRLAASEESLRCLEIARHKLDELQAKQAALSAGHRQFQDDLLGFARLLGFPTQQTSSPTLRDEQTRAVNTGEREHETVVTAHDEISIDTVRERINEGRYHDALNQVTGILKVNPNYREGQLYHLLASIHVFGVEGYERQIDSTKDITQPTESERIAMRDIFLARADQAQKIGRDDEMLRYRAWARSAFHHTPIETPDAELQESSGKAEERPSPVTSAPTDNPSAGILPALESPQVSTPQTSAEQKRRFGIFPAVVVVLITGAVTGGFLASNSKENAPASKPAAISLGNSSDVRSSQPEASAEKSSASSPTLAVAEEKTAEVPSTASAKN